MEDALLFDDPATLELRPATRLIAPWWHTVAVLLVIATWGILSGTRKHSYIGTPHAVTYLSMMLMSWMLFGSVIAGVLDRRAFFFATLRHRAQSFFADAGWGLAIYLGIYFSAFVILFVIFTGTMAYSHRIPGQTPQTSSQTDSSTTTPLPPPAPTANGSFTSLTKSHLQFDSKTAQAIAPKTWIDLLLWLCVSCTAGFCEEHIFRGYLLTQAIAFASRTGMSRLLSIGLSVIATSLIFGSLHLYEGTGGALIITALGIVYSVLALKFGNLRAVIAAHFLQDFCAGVFLFFFHARLAH